MKVKTLFRRRYPVKFSPCQTWGCVYFSKWQEILRLSQVFWFSLLIPIPQSFTIWVLPFSCLVILAFLTSFLSLGSFKCPFCWYCDSSCGLEHLFEVLTTGFSQFWIIWLFLVALLILFIPLLEVCTLLLIIHIVVHLIYRQNLQVK